MSVDFDKFLSWAESRFDGDVVVKGNEIKLNSIFCDDFKHHMWCNPGGGKKKRDNGVYHCWKTDEKGSLISLVMQVDKCDYDEALDILDHGDTSLEEMEKKLDEMFAQKVVVPKTIEPLIIKLPEFTHLITNLPPDNFFRTEAEMYLKGRRISPEGLMVCVDGDEYNYRIMVPYYDREGKLIYFNGRYIGNSKKVLRYRGPDKSIGVGKGDVVYVPHWPKNGERIYLVEGEFDALSICESGLFGGALGGKNLEEAQATMLRPYKITLCFDNDKYGKGAVAKIGDFLMSQGFTDIHFVRPPTKYKDWNEMLQDTGPKILRAYIEGREKAYNEWTGDIIRFDDV